MLKIKHGSVFDDKCDLLILPCDSGGGVTRWVQNEIQANNLPFPSGRIPFGKVLFLPTEARYAKADFVGYAASVDGMFVTSSVDAVRAILSAVVKYGNDNACSLISLPLLGTGAGGLAPGDVLDVYQRVLAHEAGTFVTYVPDKAVAQTLVGWRGDAADTEPAVEEHPRVFISYAWKDDAVRQWALELATRLCKNGVDARLDRFHLRPGMDLPQWMTNEVLKASKVLLICDSHYAEKADTRRAGVGWETMIIQGDMLLQSEVSTKYIVIAHGDFEKNTPIYMKSKLAMRKEDVDSDFDRLLEQIFDIDSAPPIGSIPRWVYERRKPKN